MPLALNGCGTWSVTLREEHELQEVDKKMFETENKLLSNPFRILHKKELGDSYRSPSVVRILKCRRSRWAEHVPRMGESRKSYIILLG